MSERNVVSQSALGYRSPRVFCVDAIPCLLAPQRKFLATLAVCCAGFYGSANLHRTDRLPVTGSGGVAPRGAEAARKVGQTPQPLHASASGRSRSTAWMSCGFKFELSGSSVTAVDVEVLENFRGCYSCAFWLSSILDRWGYVTFRHKPLK